jgi:hypothetical protein
MLKLKPEALWPALTEEGIPLTALLIGLPTMAALWMIGNKGKTQET